MPSGDAVIFWRRNEPYSDIRYRMYAQGKPGAIETIAPKSCCGDVDVSSDGTIHLIYMDETVPLVNGRWEANNHRHTLYYQALRRGVWSNRQDVANHVFWGSAHVAVEGSDKVHLFWQELSKDRFLFRHASGTLTSENTEQTAR